MIIHCIIFLHHNMLKTALISKYNEIKLYESAVTDMTAVSNKYKNKVKKHLYKARSWDTVVMVLCFITGCMAGRASWCDVALPTVCIVLACCSDIMAYRYSIIAGGLVACALAAIGNTVYIPYFLGLAVFAVLAKFLKDDRYITAGSLAVMSVAKILLVYFYMSPAYKLLAVIEAIAAYFVAQIAKDGTDHILQGKSLQGFTDTVNCLVAVLVVAVALSGGDSHWLYPGAALTLGLGWYGISMGRINLAFVSLVASAISLADKRGYIYILLCFGLLWMAGGYFSERMSFGIYPAVLFTAFVLNVLVISQVNSFVVTGSTIFALIVYILLPYFARVTPPNTTPELTAGRDWKLLMISLKKLENTLSFLAGCVIDISRLNDKKVKTDSLEDIVAEDVCRRCEKNAVCWQEKYSFTQQQFSQYGQKMYWEGENNFSTAFYHQCIKPGDIVKSFEENARLLLSKKYIRQSQKNNQKLLQAAFLSVSSAVGDLVYKNQHSYLLNTTATMELDRFLKEMNVEHTYCLCSQNPDQVTFSVHKPVEEKTLYRILGHSEKLYGVKFSQPRIEQRGGELLYIIGAKPLFEREVALETSRYKNVNGDNTDTFVHNGCFYLLLSDGMGTGSLAAAESRTVVSMAKSLITTGVSVKTAIDIINLSLNLKGGGETSASLDILCADLFTGQCVITKAGAGVSIVMETSGISRHYGDSLPLGIVRDVKAVECRFTVRAKDSIVMMSDGVGVVTGDIKNMYTQSCNQIAENIVKMNNTADDKTVAVVKLKLAV